MPTSEMLKIGAEIKLSSWIEGNNDDTSWEIGKYLVLATKCNPTVLETFLAPIERSSPFGDQVRGLFPYVWNSIGVKNAFIGYARDQGEKFVANDDRRAAKYASAYLRVLYNCYELLSSGTFSVDLRGTEVYEQCKRFKSGDYSHHEVIDACSKMERKVLKAFEVNPDKQTNLEPINEFLLRVRKATW
ncbi:MAG: uncharacterized protein JWO42_3290 [Chloroflexi bacterium]|nr:uncharacterized protein [Chloroflexota bacterium]